MKQQTFLCKACGGEVTKETKHYRKVDSIFGGKKILYECPWDIEYFEETGRLARIGLHKKVAKSCGGTVDYP